MPDTLLGMTVRVTPPLQGAANVPTARVGSNTSWYWHPSSVAVPLISFTFTRLFPTPAKTDQLVRVVRGQLAIRSSWACRSWGRFTVTLFTVTPCTEVGDVFCSWSASLPHALKRHAIAGRHPAASRKRCCTPSCHESISA